ncbi:MAG: Gfo/Idh/MocA family oxidoreductase [Chthoniobacterales bacterium]
MKPVRIGIVGAGGIVRQRHLPGLLAIPDVEIRAIANSTLESAQKFCAENALNAEAVADWHDLVKRDDIDVVWIGATPNLHKPVTLAALAAGKHVFCQARMAMNLADAREMLAASKAKPELITMLCPAPHGLQSGIYFKKLLSENIIGELREIRLQNLNAAVLDPHQAAHWRQRKEISGLNIMTLGIHVEVLQRWFGALTNVQADGKVFAPQRKDHQVEVPDALHVLADFANGAFGVLEFSGVHPGEITDRLEVAGTEGLLRYDYTKETIHLQHKGESRWETLETPEALRGGWRVEADFIEAVRNPDNKCPYPTFEDGVAYMAVVQAVNDSLSSGRREAVATV